MFTEILRTKEGMRRWADDSAATLVRLPLKDRTNGKPLGVFGFHLSANDLEVTVSGLDRPGVLAYLARAFKKFALNIESCAGEKLKHCQGSHFELISSEENVGKLAELYEYLLCDDGFRPGRLVPFDRIVDLFIEVPHDQTGLLSPVADLLADHDVNLRKFRADKEDGLFVGADPDACPVSVFARVEIPVRLDLGRLHQHLLDSCPDGSEVTLKSVLGLVDGRPKKLNCSVTLRK